MQGDIQTQGSISSIHQASGKSGRYGPKSKTQKQAVFSRAVQFPVQKTGKSSMPVVSPTTKASKSKGAGRRAESKNQADEIKTGRVVS